MQGEDQIHYQNLLRHIDKRVVLSKDEQLLASQYFRIARLPAREYLLKQGSTCGYESFVSIGSLRSFYIDDRGGEHTLHFALEDWWISDFSSFLKQLPASRSIITLEESVLLQIERKKRDELISKLPKMERFWRILNEHSSMAQDDRLLSNISMTGKERYLALLQKYPDIQQRLPQKHIASYLGITPVFLSQIRKEIAGN
ncbi:MAG: Crp/Fnr family transcriptional regulator [Sphingobacteriales bacterium]|nr:MAG: Crp/Fnr family transcriptional regulator [Sphingobacteriales bacterium]